MSKKIYFDNAASTRVLPSAANAALNCMTENFANPSSLHKSGLAAEQILTSTKKTIAKILNCDHSELFFTPSATISTNIALFGSLNFKKLSKLNKTKIITTQIEHAATRNCLACLKQQGFEIVEVPPKNKVYDVQTFTDQIDEATCLISIMHVNNENGLILPVEKIASMAKLKNKNVVVHLDCAQSFAKLPINLATVPADLISISGHKINAPKGVGVLFVRKGLRLKPILFGGGQQNSLCPGTENVPAIAGLGVAAQFHSENMKAHLEHYELLQNKLVEICSSCEKISFNFEKNFNFAQISNISINGIRSQIMLNFLEREGFLVSSGSACSKGKTGYVLTNLGYGPQRQDCSIRISFSFQTKLNEVEQLAQALILGAKKINKA